MKKKILFLMTDTGAGHRASAQAIKEAIEHLYPGKYDILIEDIWKKYTIWPFSTIPNTYGWVTGPGVPVWKAAWQMSHRPSVQRYIAEPLGSLITQGVARCVKITQPDLVVSVHPLMNDFGIQGLKAANRNVPFITVVTDLITFHPSWICNQVTRCIVPTEQARQRALELGMPAEKLAVYGQPVSLKFAEYASDKQAMRRRLGLEVDRRTVLILGSGKGFSHIHNIACQLAQALPQIQLIIVAGRNQALKAKLETVQWQIPTRLYGFVDNMPELMNAADILITKAGPSTISEAFIARLPLVLYGYIPGQEEGNVTYVLENEAGVYAETPAEITQIILDWLRPDSATLQQLTHNAARLARPDASLHIASDLCRYVSLFALSFLSCII